MKAVVFYEHGGIEVLKYEDVPIPRIAKSEVLVEVKATACNHNDIWARQGMPGLPVKLPHISGMDVAGVVSAVGGEVTNFQVGDRVLVHPGFSCRTCEYCTSGREYFCRDFTIYGFQTGPLDGGQAQFARIPSSNLLAIPENLSFTEAAALTSVLLTSWHMLVTRARISPGMDVLIMGASGGLGTTAIQLCKAFGCRVIGVVGSDEKADKIKSLGADFAIVHSKQKISDEAHRITNSRGVDLVFEHSGSWAWTDLVKSLARGGTLVTCGATSGYDARTDLRYLWTWQLNLIGSHCGTKAELSEAIQFALRNKIRPVIDRELPLSKAGEAQSMMERREIFGKIVLIPPEYVSA